MFLKNCSPQKTFIASKFPIGTTLSYTVFIAIVLSEYPKLYSIAYKYLVMASAKPLRELNTLSAWYIGITV